jgi:flagellar motility protein MotE (MotC chaperone)
MKYLFIIIGCVCSTIVAAELTGLFLLWRHGMISPHHLQEIKLVLTNRAASDEREEEIVQKPQYPSAQEVAQARAVKVLNFDKRESELTTLKGITDAKREDLESLQKQIRSRRKEFEDELARIEANITSTGTEKARGVLLVLPPKDAVLQLMQLSLDQNVVLMKGMPEKTIAKILKEFQSTQTSATDANGERKETPPERGRKIFEALSRGEPSRSLLEQQRQAANDSANDPAN